MVKYQLQVQKLLADNKLLQSELEKSKNREEKLNMRLEETEKPKKGRILCVDCGESAKLRFCNLPFCSHVCAKNVATRIKSTVS